MNISFEDGRRLRSVMWNKEQLIAKKRRLLMESTMASKPEENRRKSNKKIYFSTDLYLLESYVRNCEDNGETIRTTVKGSFSFGGTMPHHVIQDYLQLFQVHDQKNKSLVKQLPNFTSTRNHHHKEQLMHKTSAPRCCLRSINSMLEELDEMSLKELEVIQRKLNGRSVTPKFLPVDHFSGGTRARFTEGIKKKIGAFLSVLNDGEELPERLSKALSIIYLSVKNRFRHIDLPTSESCPFPPETAKFHNDIVQALWLLPKVKYDQLRVIQALLDPEVEVSTRSFRNALRKYLLECLLEWHEASTSQGLLRALDFINGRISPISEKAVQRDTEVVMILSCQLKQVISSPFSYENDDDDRQFLDDYKNDENIDVFSLVETDYFLRSGDNESCSNYEDGVTGNTGQDISTSITTVDCSFLLSQAANARSEGISTRHDFEHDDIDEEKPCVVDSIKLGLESIYQNTGNVGRKSIQEACDETALVAYKVVGSMLDKLLKIEGINADDSERSYLNGGLLVPPDLEGLEDKLTSKENATSQIFIQTVKEMLPSLTNSSMRRVENLLGELPSL